MKKSILGIVIIAMVVVAMMIGNVNAANLAVNNQEVKRKPCNHCGYTVSSFWWR